MNTTRPRREKFIRDHAGRDAPSNLRQFTDDAIDEAVHELIFWRRLRNKINAANRRVWAQKEVA
jgi:hypothetical protein